jgi:putative peptidoglycan lipid II flippase
VTDLAQRGRAGLLGGLAIAVRGGGFVRTTMFAATVGATDLGDVYSTANTIPTVVAELAAGGALAVAVVWPRRTRSG